MVVGHTVSSDFFVTAGAAVPVVFLAAVSAGRSRVVEKVSVAKAKADRMRRNYPLARAAMEGRPELGSPEPVAPLWLLVQRDFTLGPESKLFNSVFLYAYYFILFTFVEVLCLLALTSPGTHQLSALFVCLALTHMSALVINDLLEPIKDVMVGWVTTFLRSVLVIASTLILVYAALVIYRN